MVNFSDKHIDIELLFAYEEYIMSLCTNEKMLNKISYGVNLSKDKVFDILCNELGKIEKHPSYPK
jgi:hypothetical protein